MRDNENCDQPYRKFANDWKQITFLSNMFLTTIADSVIRYSSNVLFFLRLFFRLAKKKYLKAVTSHNLV